MPKKDSFEMKMRRLEEIVAILEKGECDLDESMKLFEEGVALAGACEQKLADTRAKIIKLTEVGETDE